MQIRVATQSDSFDIAELWNDMIVNTANTFTTELKTQQGIARDITVRQASGLGFFVACDDYGLAGFATYFQFRNGPGYAHTMEHSIVLRPRAQGAGVGRQLMTVLCDHAHENGVHSIFAGVSGENPAGVVFHERIGFQRIATLPQVGYKFGRWMDLVLLQKILGQSA